jgi:hypothetical protein
MSDLFPFGKYRGEHVDVLVADKSQHGKGARP